MFYKLDKDCDHVFIVYITHGSSNETWIERWEFLLCGGVLMNNFLSACEWKSYYKN